MQHEEIRQAVRRFAQEQLAPNAARWDREKHFPREALKGLAAMGLYGVAIAEKWDGAGLDYTSLAIACEEIAAGDCSTATIIAVNNLVAGIVSGYGNPDQKEQFLKPLASGKMLGAFALAACWRAPLRGIDFGPSQDPFRSEGYVDADEIQSAPIYRLVLVGDGGEPGRDGSTLALLGEWGDAHPGRTAVVFLGDNLYPAGLAFRGRARARGEAILLQQIRASHA